MMIALGNYFFRARNALFPAACLLVLLPGPRIMHDPITALLLGFMIASLGQGYRFATIGLEYIVRGGRDRRVYAEDLVTGGLYAHSRNPMYVGNLLMLTGIAMASNSWTCVIVTVPAFAFIYAAIVAAEESFLRAKFGAAFDAYVGHVPRWTPRLRGIGQTLSDSRFHWRRVAIKEYGTTAALIIGMCAIGVLNLWRAGRLTSQASIVEVLIAVAMASAFAWAIVRVLKKSRRLAAD